MVRYSYGKDFDQHDHKLFKESLGTFGTTTLPGGNQLQELQAKVRQGVKHVELHLASRAKGQFGKMDTPDKYGYQERKTIMQLAKLNKQTLSVHGTFDITSLSGLEQRGFNEVNRWESINELDHTISFAAQTAKEGAVVLHLQGDAISGGRGISLSSKYLKWLEENGKKDELDRLKKEYFSKNPLDRKFVDNPEKLSEIKFDYENLEKHRREQFEKEHVDDIKSGKKPWDLYYLENQIEKRKLAPDVNPLIVVGDQIANVDRKQEFVDISKLKDQSNFSKDELDILKKSGIKTGDDISIEDFQKAMATFTNGKPQEMIVSENIFNNLKKKLLVNYEKVLEENEYMETKADTDFFKRFNKLNVDVFDLQKQNLENKYKMFKDELGRVKLLEAENQKALSRISRLKGETKEEKAAIDAIKIHISEKNREIQHLKSSVIGYEDYQTLSHYNESIADLNKKKNELKKQIDNSKSLADESFERNTSALGYLGLKALKYQMDMKIKAKESEKILPELRSELSKLEREYYETKDAQKQQEIESKITQTKKKLNQWVGSCDYADIDLINKPLYVAPENMLPGMGSFTSIEEFKALVRIGQEDFAKKILSGDESFKEIKENYEKLTGVKIQTIDDAKKLAKRHLSGTFDTAHAGAWLKHFKKNEGESEEHKLDRFNKWLADEAETMIKEGLVKHVHFNNTTGKDDDHNLISSGILDMEEFRRRIRKAGVREALIVEAGGRGPDKNMHLMSTFEMFNPSIKSSEGASVVGGVSNWVNVRRQYDLRPQYSKYGMGQSTFRHIPPQDNEQRGEWSGTSLL